MLLAAKLQLFYESCKRIDVFEVNCSVFLRINGESGRITTLLGKIIKLIVDS